MHKPYYREHQTKGSLLSVRKMRITDIKEVCALEQSTFETPWSAGSLMSQVLSPDSCSCVAEVGAEFAGYLTAWQAADETQIGNIAVMPVHRRRGVAAALLQHLIDFCRNSEVLSIHLEVRISNIAAQELYKKFGFAKSGVRRNYYYKEREDALLMSLSLKEDTRYGLV